MLTVTPIPLSQPEVLAVAEFLGHKGRPILERVVKGTIVQAVQLSGEIDLDKPLNVLADGPQALKSRELCIGAARLKIFLEVLEDLSKPEATFEVRKFEVT